MKKGVLLVGYDVERIPGRVPGEKWVGRKLREDTTAVFLEKILRLHQELEVPATIFMVGCNVAQHVPALAACRDSGWFEIAQHTWAHPDQDGRRRARRRYSCRGCPSTGSRSRSRGRSRRCVSIWGSPAPG